MRLIPLTLPLAFLACARIAPTPRADANAAAPAEYFPLAVGNTWVFLDRSTQKEAHHTVRIVRRDEDGYFVDDQHGALRADADCLHDRRRNLLCRPIAKGTTWSSVVSPSATERYEIAGVNETVTVPAGTFHGCVRVRSQLHAGGVEQVAELTYAPSVGPVRVETFVVVDAVPKRQITGELESYRIGGR
ncbi:MAG TPA: hypothetical protein VMK12_14335 [Anaeromyxobacteraceae bacterium]|nr:hypothetical protein [Anaeromyxobacteraceae bacterium]